MLIIHNHLIPFKGYDAINLFGILFCHKKTTLTADLIQHERIHTAQMVEMGIVFFYLFYILEWIIRIPLKGRAYTNISFEREAYAHMHDKNYLLKRKHYAWFKHLIRC